MDHIDIKDIILDWRRECGFPLNDPWIVVHIDDEYTYIITTRPGIMIGYHGEMVYKYQEILKDNGYTKPVKFIEICKYGVTTF